MFTKQTVRDIDVKDKRIIVRAMLNVPIEDGEVGDKMRLQAALPTLKYLLEHGASLVLISHHSDTKQSLAPVAPVLAELLDTKIEFVPESIGDEVEAKVKALQPGQVIMLENLRFHPEEEANDDGFARQLASYGDKYVDDDFTTSHRKHASIIGIPKYLPTVAGFQVQKEVETITKALENPKRPLVAIVGGAKISTKIPIISFLINKVDALFIGGAQANTLLAAQGKPVGKSLVEPDQYETALQVIKLAAEQHKTLLLPIDVVVTKDIATAADVRTLLVDEIAEDDIIADLGPQTIAQLDTVLQADGSAIWNGPVGIAEEEAFAAGTEAVAQKIIGSGAFSLVGGGDSADYINEHGLADKFSFLSTGGGASLELMSGNPLPGVEALLDNPHPK
jgi:phosphoglycerate kinase